MIIEISIYYECDEPWIIPEKNPCVKRLSTNQQIEVSDHQAASTAKHLTLSHLPVPSSQFLAPRASSCARSESSALMVNDTKPLPVLDIFGMGQNTYKKCTDVNTLLNMVQVLMHRYVF